MKSIIKLVNKVGCMQLNAHYHFWPERLDGTIKSIKWAGRERDVRNIKLSLTLSYPKI